MSDLATPADFEIIDIQENFIVVNKAAGINFHDENELGQGLFNLVCQQFNQADTDKLFPVHRLDKMTSGLIIFARNLASAQQFQQLFSQHDIEKYYLAISDKKPKKKQGLIKGDMEKSRRGSWKLVRSQNNPAISQFLSYPLSGGKRLYLIKPHSGKTHQIRVALSSIGAPILGDERYYGKSPLKANNEDRGYLHAYALSFALNDHNYHYILPPNSGKHYLAAITIKQLESLQTPWLLNWPKV
ncbi:MAG: TIGR01621 family pseudouridine synthase [Colwellia sp.]|nr:TIGR01621 family pseudouridine synthase [Colwellia sp.]